MKDIFDIIKSSPLFVFIFLIVIFLGMNILPIGGKFIGGLDVSFYFYWHESFIKTQLLSGSLPLWNPYYYCGHPFIANPQTFVFYPITLLYILLPLPWAFNMDVVIHMLVSALGAYYFVRTITESHLAGLVSGCVYCFNGYMLDNLFAGHLTMLHTAALIPWIFLFIEKGIQTEKTGFFVASGLVFGVQILGGEPQNNYYTIVFLTIYYFLRNLGIRKTKRDLPVSRLFFLYMMVPGVAFILSSIQVLPSLEFMMNSDRSGNSYEFATVLSYPYNHFFTLFVPKVSQDLFKTNWEMSGYIGILAMMLAVIGGFFSEKKNYSFIFVALAIIAAALMLGEYNPLYYLFYKLVPGFSLFRIPARWIVFLVFSLSILAGMGASHLLSASISKNHHMVLTCYLILSILLISFIAFVSRIPFSSKEMLFAFVLSIISYAVVMLCLRFNDARITPLPLLFLLFIDPYIIYAKQTPSLNETELTRVKEYENISLHDDAPFHRVLFRLGAARGMYYHYYQVNGYTPISEGRYYKYMHDMADLPIFQAARHELFPDIFQTQRVLSSKILGIKYAMEEVQGEYRVMSTQDYQPRATIVRNIIFTNTLDEHLQYLKDERFNPRNTALLLEKSKSKVADIRENSMAGHVDNTGGVNITQYSPNKIDLASDSGSSSLLLLSELYYPGWKAYVDGRRVPILRADYILRAIPLPPGRHEISFVYRPASFIIGAVITLVTVFILIWRGLTVTIGNRKAGEQQS